MGHVKDDCQPFTKNRNKGGLGAVGLKFIERAHLENLKVEDIEDQMLAKKITDIICSPRRKKEELARGSFVSVVSRGTPHTVKRNGYKKEVFWTNGFIQSLQKRKITR